MSHTDIYNRTPTRKKSTGFARNPVNRHAINVPDSDSPPAPSALPDDYDELNTTLNSQYSELEYQEDEPMPEPDPEPAEPDNVSGNYVITGTALAESLKRAHACPDQYINVSEVREDRQGHYSVLRFSCNKCHAAFYANDPAADILHSRLGKPLNDGFVLAAYVTGIDKVQLQKLCSVIGIDGPPDGFHSTYQQDINARLTNIIQSKLEANRSKAHRVRGSDGSAPTQIGISCDGTYAKRGDRSRGYSSKIGVTIVFDAETNLVLDFEIESKFCHKCAQAKPSDDNEVSHEGECQQNFEGPSSEMERKSIKAMFQRSRQFNLIYKDLVSDGDTKAISDVWDVYGLCGVCEQHSDILSDKKKFAAWEAANSTEHQAWVAAHNSDEHECHIVVKIDCVNHVSKNFASKIMKAAKDGEIAEDGKSVNRGVHRLGPAFAEYKKMATRRK